MLLKLYGYVIHGDGYGRQLGFPTANIDRRHWSRIKPKIKYGIYAGLTHCGQHSYLSAIVIGPNDQNGLPKLETHMIGYSGDMYGKKIMIELRDYIRPFRKYDSEQSLKTAIQNDIKKINSLLS